MSEIRFFGVRFGLLVGGVSILSLCAARPSLAFEYDFNNGVSIQFDNTFQYSLLERTAPELPVFANSINSNDGDNNLRAGIVSNRADLLTNFGISDNGYGFDTSIDSFYDSVYNQHTQNSNPTSYNPANEPPEKFTSATRTVAGRDIELRNLFVYGSQTVAGVPVTLRVGRLVNLFGETLLFAQNGIAYGNAPIDVERANDVPNTQAKDLFLPVGQALISAQFTDAISVSAYYQFEFEPFIIPPAGSYFNTTVDMVGAGGQRLIAKPVGSPGLPPNTAAYLYRGPDQRGSDTGQFGIALHYDPVGSPYDFGLYALQYNDSEPQLYAELSAKTRILPPPYPGAPVVADVGTYQMVYADHIQVYGVSASSTFGPANVAGEVSIRTNDDLVSSVTVPAGAKIPNNSNNPAYATGNTLHYQASTVYVGSKGRFWDSSSLIGEIAGDNLLGFDKNRQNYGYAAKVRMALGLRAKYTLTYYDVLPGLDVNPNIALGWNFMGKAPDTRVFNTTGIDRGGDLTIGISVVYLANWRGGITYTRYISPPGRDTYADRDFAAFNVERTF